MPTLFISSPSEFEVPEELQSFWRYAELGLQMRMQLFIEAHANVLPWLINLLAKKPLNQKCHIFNTSYFWQALVNRYQISAVKEKAHIRHILLLYRNQFTLTESQQLDILQIITSELNEALKSNTPLAIQMCLTWMSILWRDSQSIKNHILITFLNDVALTKSIASHLFSENKVLRLAVMNLLAELLQHDQAGWLRAYLIATKKLGSLLVLFFISEEGSFTWLQVIYGCLLHSHVLNNRAQFYIEQQGFLKNLQPFLDSDAAMHVILGLNFLTAYIGSKNAEIRAQIAFQFIQVKWLDYLQHKNMTIRWAGVQLFASILAHIPLTYIADNLMLFKHAMTSILMILRMEIVNVKRLGPVFQILHDICFRLRQHPALQDWVKKYSEVMAAVLKQFHQKNGILIPEELQNIYQLLLMVANQVALPIILIKAPRITASRPLLENLPKENNENYHVQCQRHPSGC